MKATRKYLEQLEKIDVMILNKQIEQQQLMDMALSVTSGSRSVIVEVLKDGKLRYELQNMERVQASGESSSKMADAINKCLDLWGEIADCIDSLIDLKREVTSVIESLSVAQYDLMHKVYVQHLTLSDAAAKMGKSYEWARKVHGSALQNVKRILNEKKR